MARSWDLWDTLITRRVVSPLHVFDLVEEISGVSGFAESRIKSEREARRNVEEVTLRDIYNGLPYDLKTKEKLFSIELKIEFELVEPIPCNIDRLAEDDIVLTDMYLDKHFLISLARKCGIGLPEANFYVSSSIRLTKRTGRLFKHALVDHHINSHIGDNMNSDVLIARSMGIQAIHYACSGKLTRTEKYWMSTGNRGWKIAGALRAARLARPPSHDKAVWEIFSQVVAPFLIAFCETLLARAKEEDISSIYFLSRDGEILHKICKALMLHTDYAFKLTYLHVSRNALYLPAFNNLEKSRSWILAKPWPITKKELSDRLGLSADALDLIIDLNTEDAVADEDILTPVILEKAMGSRALEEAVQEISRNRLAGCRRYFSRMGLIEHVDKGTKFGVVDIGWRGSLQESIDVILRKFCDRDPMSYGFYIATRNSVFQDGKRVWGAFYDQFRKNNPVPETWISQYTNLLEFFLRGTHPQVMSYNEITGDPVMAESLSQEDMAARALAHEAILTTVAMYSRQRQYLPDVSPIGVHEAFEPLRRTVAAPQKKEAAAFVQSWHSTGQLGNGDFPLVQKISAFQAIFPTSSVRAGWAEASYAYSNLLWIYNFRKSAAKFWKIIKLCKRYFVRK